MKWFMAKGDLGQECARGACNESPATYYNRETQKHYCRWCAIRINESWAVTVAQHNVRNDPYKLSAEPLCKLVEGVINNNS